jgi:hypothetical protein
MVCYTFLTNVLRRRVVPYAEEILGDHQCGFWKGRSTADNLFMLRCILEKSYELNLNLHLLFIDFKQSLTQ